MALAIGVYITFFLNIYIINMIKEIIPNIIKSPLIVDPLCCIRSSEEIMMMMPKTNIVIIPNTIPNMPIPKNLEFN
jgi:hypothetical protein